MRAWLSTVVFLPGESHGKRSLVGYNPEVCKESAMTEQLALSFLHMVVRSGRGVGSSSL